MNFHYVIKEKKKPYLLQNNYEEIRPLYDFSEKNNNFTNLSLNNCPDEYYENFEKNIEQITDINLLITIEEVKEKINKINFVYQPLYTNRNVTGFGDFIRGCYFIFQFCEIYEFSYEIIVNHPIKNLLLGSTTPSSDYIIGNYNDYYYIDKSECANNNETMEEIRDKYSNVEFYDNLFINNVKNENYLKDFFIHLNSVPVFDKNVYLYTNAFTINENISRHHKENMKKILEPKKCVKDRVNIVLNYLKLKKQQYITIHIRSGDKHLIDSEKIDNDKFLLILNEINKLFKIFPNNVLLLSDNIDLKIKLAKVKPFKCIINNIIHLGENVIMTAHEDHLLNTLVDFYLITYSKYVYSYSFYEHGTGFSEWACKTFDIPYHCKFLS